MSLDSSKIEYENSVDSIAFYGSDLTHSEDDFRRLEVEIYFTGTAISRGTIKYSGSVYIPEYNDTL